MIIDKLFALKKVPIFRELDDPELILIADAGVVRRFEPGMLIAAGDTVLNWLVVVVEGAAVWESTGEPAFPVIGIDSMVAEERLESALLAGSPGGAGCLLISKGHFYTIINECPELVTAYLQRDHADGIDSGESA